MDLSNYVFRAQDLPIIISGTLLALYIVYLAVLFFKSTSANKRRGSTSRSTRAVNPKLGFLGLFGFAGFLGFWTYRVDQTIFPFVFCVFGFSDFSMRKMSNAPIDERYKESKMRAQSWWTKTALSIFLQYWFWDERLMGCLEYTLIALVIVIALSIALELFLEWVSAISLWPRWTVWWKWGINVPDFECRLKVQALLKGWPEQLAAQVGVRRETIMRLEKQYTILT